MKQGENSLTYHSGVHIIATGSYMPRNAYLIGIKHLKRKAQRNLINSS